MRRKLLFFAFTLLMSIGSFAQTVDAFKYQAVLRSGGTQVISNQNVGLRFSIREASPNGVEVYSEEHQVVTNPIGLVNLEIGNGQNVFGDMRTLNWGDERYFVRTELDATGGSNYVFLGVSELLAVPYAFKAGDVVQKQDLERTGDSVRVTDNDNAAWLDLRDLRDNTDDQSMRFQNGLVILSRELTEDTADLNPYIQARLNQFGLDSVLGVNNQAAGQSIENVGRIGIGTTAGNTLHIVDTVDQHSPNYSYSIFGQISGGNTAGRFRAGMYLEMDGSDGENFAIDGTSLGNSAGINTGVGGFARGSSSYNRGVQANGIGGQQAVGLDALADGGSQQTVGVLGEASNGGSDQAGVRGFIDSAGTTNSGRNWGVNGFVLSESTLPNGNIGVEGAAAGSHSGDNVGVLGQASNGATNTGGYFRVGAPAAGNFAMGVNGGSEQVSSGINIGMYGIAANSTNINRGVQGVLFGQTNRGRLQDAAVYGLTAGTTGWSTAVLGRARNANPTDTNVALLGFAESGAENYALWTEAGDAMFRDTAIFNYGSIQNGYILTSDANGRATWQPNVADSTRLTDADNDTHVEVEQATDDDLIRYTVRGTEYFRMDTGKLFFLNTNANTFIGEQSGLSYGYSSAGNTGLGFLTLRLLTGGRDNTAIGADALSSIVNSSENTAVGKGSMTSVTTSGGGNTAVGFSSMLNAGGLRNVAIGRGALQNNASGSYNVAVGNQSGFNSSGSNNIFLGREAGLGSSVSDKLYIENSNSSSPLIYGDFASDSVRINGSLMVRDDLYVDTANAQNDYVLTSDASGNATWQAAAAEDTTNELISQITLLSNDSLEIQEGGVSQYVDLERLSNGWEVNTTGTDTVLFNNNYQVGVGVSSSLSAPFQVETNNTSEAGWMRNTSTLGTPTYAGTIWNTGAGAGERYAGWFQVSGNGTGDKYAGWFRATGANGTNNYAINSLASGATNNWGALLNASDTNASVNYGIQASASGAATNWAGYFSDGNVYVQDTLQLATGAQNGYVLTSDANGKATWQAASSGGQDSTRLTDADGDTKIQVEENTDDDRIRFDVAGFERMTLDSTLRIRSNHTGSGVQHGITNIINTGTGTMSGITNTISRTSGSGNIYGVQNNIANNGGGAVYSYYSSDVSSTGSALYYGLFNSFSDGTGAKTGVYNLFQQNGALGLTGMYNSMNHSGTGIVRGVYNQWLTSTGSGTQIGLSNTLTNSGTGNKWGVNTTITHASATNITGSEVTLTHNGTGSAYGYKATLLGSSSEKYGLYLEGADSNLIEGILKVADSLLLPTGAQNGYVLTSNADGLATWQAASTSSPQDIDSVLSVGSNAGNDSIYNLGILGMGTSSPTATIDVVNNTENFNLSILNSKVTGVGEVKGVFSSVTGTGASDKFGLYGEALNGTGINNGVFGEARRTGGVGVTYGIYGRASGGATNWAGYFDQGDVFITNSLGIGIGGAPSHALDVAGTALIDKILTDSANVDTLISTLSFIDSLRIGNAYSFPSVAGSNGQVLEYNGSGDLVWITPSGALVWDTNATTVFLPTQKNLRIGGNDTALSDIHLGAFGHLQWADLGGDSSMFMSQNLHYDGTNLKYTLDGPNSLFFAAEEEAGIIISRPRPAGTTWNLNNDALTNFRVDAGGVGINTDSPNYALDINPVNDSIAIFINSNGNDASSIVITDSSGSNFIAIRPAEEMDTSYAIIFPDTAPAQGQFMVYDTTAQGMIWTTSGSSTCPAGMVNYGVSGCIDDAERAAATWFVANSTCISLGYQLADYGEWYGATSNASLVNETDNWEWVRNISQNKMMVVGNGGLTNRAFQDPTTTAAYRCSYRKD